MYQKVAKGRQLFLRARKLTLQAGKIYSGFKLLKKMWQVMLRERAGHSITFPLETNGGLEERLGEKALPTRVDTFIELDGGFRWLGEELWSFQVMVLDCKR